MYELERRAVFSKKWILVSHKLRFVNAGDFVCITEAGFPFFLIKDRVGNINAFHNVCRHRAYPVIEKGSGTASVLACKYHGWSYGFTGNLAKAPKYQDVKDFDKTANGLYKIHVHVDKLGFVWINLDAESRPSVPWEHDFAGVDTQPRLQPFDLTKFQFDHQWEMIGDYNWKTLADNYNEVLREDKDLCNAAQKNLEVGIFTNGELHPQAEKGPLYFQQVTRQLVMSHRGEGKASGKEHWPATPKQKSSAASDDDVDFCASLKCPEESKDLSW
ncbi:hypothetical protein E8E14_010107 [Neopestalotiopsis sp. 37M]|nr:hypothetical protein E8E14_010107 [Neopestalotiopsis sp. 37M]